MAEGSPDLSWIMDVVTLLVPLVVLFVTLQFNKKQNDARAQQEKDARRFSPLSEACARVVAEWERLNDWANSEETALYEGPPPEPWDVAQVVAPLRAAVTAVELIGGANTAAAATALMADASQMVEIDSPETYKSFTRARDKFVAAVRQKLACE